MSADYPGSAKDSPLVALHSATGTALIAATVLASMVGFLDAYAAPCPSQSRGDTVTRRRHHLSEES
jgi:hypothetical protein